MKINFKREPVAWVAAVHAVLALAAGFGVHITVQQMALVETALTTIGALIIRQNVYAPTDANGAPIIVAGKPAPVADPEILHVESDTESPRLHQWTDEELMDEYLKRQKESKGGTP